jgi:hypothetical protein
MRQNVGGRDRTIRWVIAAVFLAIAFFIQFPGWWTAVPAAIGLAALATAVLRYCPLNHALGVDTRRGR